MTARTPIPLLNAAFIRLTGNPRPLNWHAEYAWCQWLKHSDPEWMVEDLEMVVAYMRQRMKRPGRPDDVGYTPFSLSFRQLIEDPENFLHILSLARTEQMRRVTPLTQREKVMELTGRKTNEIRPGSEAVSAGTVLERTKLAGMLGEWKAKTNL